MRTTDLPGRTRATSATSDGGPPADPLRRAAAWVLDVALLCAFIAAGRSSHQEGASGFVTTALPFFAALQLGWLLLGRRRATTLLAGTIVWATTVVVGLAVRLATGDTAAPGFVIVTAIVLGIAFLGWRLVARLVSALRRRRERAADADSSAHRRRERAADADSSAHRRRDNGANS